MECRSGRAAAGGSRGRAAPPFLRRYRRWSDESWRADRDAAEPPTAAAAGAAFAAGAGTGAVGAYLLDPENGKRRRHVALDRLAALGRRGAREAERKSRYASG